MEQCHRRKWLTPLKFLKSDNFLWTEQCSSNLRRKKPSSSPSEKPLMSQYSTTHRDCGYQQTLLLPLFLSHVLIPSPLKLWWDEQRICKNICGRVATRNEIATHQLSWHYRLDSGVHCSVQKGNKISYPR